MTEHAQITLETGLSNPHEFVASVFQQVESGHPFAQQAVVKARELGLLDDATVAVDATTWVSGTGDADGHPVLGIRPMDAALKNRTIFHHTSFSYADEIAYRLVRQLGHTVASSVSVVNERLPELTALCRDVRSSNPDHGLTGHAGLEYFQGKGPNVQAQEDVAELVAMFLWDPAYFSEYMDFLSSANPAYLHRNGLTDISPESAQGIAKTIENAVKQFAEMPQA